MIRLRGARTHNLQSVDVDIAAGRWTALCGVSGSGKSSLAIHTLHAEAERRWLATLPSAFRLLGDALPRPDLDSAEGLPPTAALLQESPSPDPRTTLAGHAGLQAPLAALWSAFSTCRSPATGKPMRRTTVAEAARDVLSRASGVRIQVVFAPPATERDPEAWTRRGFVRARLVDGVSVELQDIPCEPAPPTFHVVVDRLVAEGRHEHRLREAIETAWSHGNGVCAIEALPSDGAPPQWIPASSSPLCLETGLRAPIPAPSLFSRFSPKGFCPRCQGLPSQSPCASCGGSGLREEASWFHLGGASFVGLCRMDCDDALAWAVSPELESLRGGPGRDLVDEIRRRLGCLARLGLGYLPLDRPASTLSMGEERRVRLAGLLGAPLSGIAWILDEPSTGLHPRDLPSLHALLRDLVADGATLLTIEHDLRSLSACDHVIETGPGPGRTGGRIVADIEPARLAGQETPSGRWLSGRSRPPRPAARVAWGACRVRGASGRNLSIPDLELPLGVLIGVSGVSGAGKSSLLVDTIAPALARHLGRTAPEPLPHEALELRGPLASVETILGHGEAVRSPRSTVASLSGILDPLRDLFASLPLSKERGWSASRFSPNVKGGRCEHCEGLGEIRISLHLLPDAWTPCPHCDGTRYAASTLDARWKGLHIAQVLELDLESLAALAANHPRLGAMTDRLVQVGLGHLTAGRRASTLSGGELLRLRMVGEIGSGSARNRQFWILDEPSRGLHPQDVTRLVAAFHQLLDAGHAIAAITHDPFLLSRCQHVVELGPGAGKDGGRVLYSGDVAGLAASGAPSSESVARELST